MAKIKSFTELEVWQEAHRLVLAVYRISKDFPREERYGLTSQIRRAVVSVPANIAEGFKRNGIRDKLRFYNISESSLEEVKYFLILARDLQYLTDKTDLFRQAETVGRLLNGLSRSTRRRL
jgi:four helix bundle protein